MPTTHFPKSILPGYSGNVSIFLTQDALIGKEILTAHSFQFCNITVRQRCTHIGRNDIIKANEAKHRTLY